MKSTSLWVAGVIFLAICFMHIVRYIKMWGIVVGTFHIPLEWSIYAAVVTGILAIWMFIAAGD